MIRRWKDWMTCQVVACRKSNVVENFIDSKSGRGRLREVDRMERISLEIQITDPAAMLVYCVHDSDP